MNNLKIQQRIMKTIKTNAEFASELVCIIPYAYWLNQMGGLEKVVKLEENVKEREDEIDDIFRILDAT